MDENKSKIDMILKNAQPTEQEEKQLDAAKLEMITKNKAMDEAKNTMDVSFKVSSSRLPGTVARKNYLDNVELHKTAKKKYDMAEKSYNTAQKFFDMKNEEYLTLLNKKKEFKNDDAGFLEYLQNEDLTKIKDKKLNANKSMFSPFSTSSTEPSSPQITSSAAFAAIDDNTPGKEITIKFIQHAATKQCFIKEYNICDAPNAKQSINVADANLPSRLVLDTNNQPVTENIQNVTKNITASTSCPTPQVTPGGYDANKRSRSVGTKRKTIRQAKRHARRSRRSRPSRFSL
jgi:hypothetical protein